MSATADVLEHAPQAGRMCPTDYSYPPSVFARPADISAETLYVVGGLYGNLAALKTIEAMAASERRPPEIVFNGDFHWFDAETDWFAAVDEHVSTYPALRGNVETEIAREGDIGAGCGCAYPETVGEDVVRRSNAILAELTTVTPESVRRRLRALPMHFVATVGVLRVGIVHGDAQALAGWRFAADYLDKPQHRHWLDEVHSASNIDVFACTHTCEAALRSFDLAEGRLTIINNGAAGMANFVNTQFGVITRIATSPSPHQPLYGRVQAGVHIDALPVTFDHTAFVTRFLRRWPEGSPAHASYFKRITAGPDYALDRAAGR